MKTFYVIENSHSYRSGVDLECKKKAETYFCKMNITIIFVIIVMIIVVIIIIIVNVAITFSYFSMIIWLLLMSSLTLFYYH